MSRGPPRPPRPFPPIRPHRLAAGTPLHRNHDSGYRPDQFNPCLGAPARFSPIEDAAGRCVPSLYAAATREAAAFETIFRGADPGARFNTAPLQVVEARSASVVAPRRDLRLAPLFAPDLAAWGRLVTDLIHTHEATYARTAAWARAVHHADASVDGLIWTSRRCDPDWCVILFGDRVAGTDLDVRECLDVARSPDLLLELRGFGLRAGVTITN